MMFGTAGRPAPGTNPAVPAAATWQPGRLVGPRRPDARRRPAVRLARPRPRSPCPGRRAATGGPSTAWRVSPARSCWPASASRATRGAGLDELVDRYAAGIAAGTDPSSPDRWVRLDEHPQAKVEAASIALVLDLTRPWIWDRLAAAVRERVVDYLRPGGRRRHVPTDQLGLVPPGRADVPALGRRAALARRDGRGPRHPRRLRPRRTAGCPTGRDRAYDHYVGWALHLYPTLWARMAGAARPRRAAPRTRPGRRSTASCVDAVALVGRRRIAADPGTQPDLPVRRRRAVLGRRHRRRALGQPRPAAPRGHPHRAPLRRHTVPRTNAACSPSAGTGRGRGWRSRTPGPGSPYWASKGLLGIALPADHPVWTAAEEPLPGRGAATRCGRYARRAGSSSGTRADGIVRVVNHGTDHAVEGATGRRLAALRPAGLLHRHQPRPRRQRLGQSARPVRHPRRRRGSGHPPHRHAPADRARRRPTASGWPDRVPSPTGSTRIPVSAITAAAARAGPDRPGTSRCTRWCAAPGNCGWPASTTSPTVSRRLRCGYGSAAGPSPGTRRRPWATGWRP